MVDVASPPRSCTSDLEAIHSPKMFFLRRTVTFFAFVAPPVDETGIAFGYLLMPSSVTCDSNLVWIGRSVCDLWHFVWNRPLPLTSEADYGRTIRAVERAKGGFSSDRSRDHVCRFLWDLDKNWSKRSEKCVLEKIQNGGKSILAQMGVAYVERCVMDQGIQGKKNF